MECVFERKLAMAMARKGEQESCLLVLRVRGKTEKGKIRQRDASSLPFSRKEAFSARAIAIVQGQSRANLTLPDPEKA